MRILDVVTTMEKARRAASTRFHGQAANGEDQGLFGPDSVAWKVWSHPAAVLGVYRSFFVEEMHPLAAAAVFDHDVYRTDPFGRFARTVEFFYAFVFGDTPTVESAVALRRRIHARVRGTDPVTGRKYDGNDPYLMLGTNVMTWHSIIYCYETFVGRLTPAEEAQFFQESVKASTALGLTVEKVRAAGDRLQVTGDFADSFRVLPTTREEFREILAHGNTGFANTAATYDIFQGLLLKQIPDHRKDLQVLGRAMQPLIRGIVATIPVELRKITGLPTGRAADAAAVLAVRAALVPGTKIPTVNALNLFCAPAFAMKRQAHNNVKRAPAKVRDQDLASA